MASKRHCPLCNKAPREGEQMFIFRLAPEDLAAVAKPKVEEPGLYSGCTECYQVFRPVIAERVAPELTTRAADGSLRPKRPDEVNDGELC